MKRALIDNRLSRTLHANDYAWTYLWSMDSPLAVQLHQIVAVGLGLCVCFGVLTRISVPAAWFIDVDGLPSETGFLFGLDQVVMMLAMYLCVAPSGSLWSVDARWAATLRRSLVELGCGLVVPRGRPHASTTVATRLMLIHLCIVYMFGGLAKLRGEMWWDGSAMWFSAAAYEYQSWGPNLARLIFRPQPPS